jgi:outer membrane protein insertion porin family
MKLGVGLWRGLSVVCFVLGGAVFGIVPAVLPVGVAYAQTANSIVVEGNRRVEANTIRSYFKPGRDGRLGPHELDEAYKALIATGLFQDVRIEVKGGRIIVTVFENAVINRIAFEGNDKVKDEQLKLEIQSKERGTLSRPVVQNDVQRIVEIYRRTGRYDITVDPKIIELANNRVDLVFEITEGPKTGIKVIDFVGNRAYSGYRLKEVIKTTETGILAFLQTGNTYDQDRVEADRELLRRFYLKHGYIDVRIIAARGEYDPERRGFAIIFQIEEGEQYRVGTVEVQSNVRTLDPGVLRPRLRSFAGDVFNAEAVEKTVEDMTIEAARQGFAFVAVRPRADRDFQARRVNLVFTIDDGQRAYIEQINIRGNTRTRDHVIRREFDVAEGDPYNRALIARAERRLKNLTYFKEVKVTTEPGSAPDRVVITVLVEEQSTGEFSVAGGYSTSDGFMGEVSVAERNLLGLGLYAKAAVQYGQNASGYQLTFVEPYLLGYRLAWGLDLFQKIQKSTQYTSYETTTIGASTRLGFALREDLGLQLRYSIYQQKVELPQILRNCNNISPNFVSGGTFPTPAAFFNGTQFQSATDYQNSWINAGSPAQYNCTQDGEASLAVRRELAQGAILTSLVGYDLTHNTLDNNRNPTSGLIAILKQDFAGVGGDVQFVRTTADLRTYYEVYQDIVGVLHLQAGHVAGWGGQGLRMLDHFQMGPNLVRGFTPSGIGPRDLSVGTAGDALGGSMYWGASVEFQTPLYFLPKESGVKIALFADAGSLWSYKGPTDWLPPVPGATGESFTPSSNGMFINSSVGVGLLWASPFGPLRFDLAYPITSQSFDRKQMFRFGGGTTF